LYIIVYIIGSNPIPSALTDCLVGKALLKNVSCKSECNSVWKNAWLGKQIIKFIKYMNYTQSIGNITELLCIAKFIELGYECSIPYGNGAKYDFLVDLEDKIIRVQCKSSTQVKKKNGELDDAFRFYTVSQTTNTQKTVRHSYDKTQIDYFATVYNNQVYLIPVEECSTSKTLRLSPPLNNNSAYNKAEDYEIEKMISISRELLNTK